MHIAVLGSLESWYVKDLRRVGGDHQIVPVTYRALRAWIEQGHQRLDGFSAVGAEDQSQPVELDKFDAVLVRTMPPGTLEQVVFRMDALHRLEAAGVPVVNPPRAIEIAVDKFLASSRLAAAGVPTPSTVACETAEQAMDAFSKLGGDVVVKPLFGSEGRGIIRVGDPDLAYRAFTTLERLGAVIYQQRFIPHEGFDVRALVLDRRVVAAMRRTSRDDWRTNVSRGARAEPVCLSEREQELALSAADAVAAPLAGVDLLPARDGCCYVLEVNAVPGWRALAKATGTDIAQTIIAYVRSQTRSVSENDRTC
jgi:ribosomal protein S6--L-glutamate ligase